MNPDDNDGFDEPAGKAATPAQQLKMLKGTSGGLSLAYKLMSSQLHVHINSPVQCLKASFGLVRESGEEYYNACGRTSLLCAVCRWAVGKGTAFMANSARAV